MIERKARVPVLDRIGQRRAASDRQRMRGRELPRLLEYGARLGNVAQGEVFLDGAWIDVALERFVNQERFELGAENERAVAQERVMERLDPQTVARKK